MPGEGKKAFTLAEVLITIAIIGVVAAMTIPNLVTDLQNRDWNTSDEVFIKKLEQSLKVMNVQSVLSGYDTTEEFVGELQKHFKITRICDNNNLGSCFNEKFFTVKKNTMLTSNFTTSETFVEEDWGTNVVGLQFANGVTALLAYNPKCEENPHNSMTPVMNCVAVLYDVNGKAKPTQMSKDIRKTANVSKDITDPLIIKGIQIAKIVKPGEIPWVFYNNGVWGSCEEFMSEYGTSACYRGSGGIPDFHASAAAACGGWDNIATQTELNAIAGYLYNSDSIKPDQITTIDIDKSIHNELITYGFPSNLPFTVFDNKFYGDGLYGWAFTEESTSPVNAFRHTADAPVSGWGVICVKR